MIADTWFVLPVDGFRYHTAIQPYLSSCEHCAPVLMKFALNRL